VRVLLDENLPQKLRYALGKRDISTVGYMGWNGLKNGELLRAAEKNGIDVLVTGDQSLPNEQSLAGRHIAVVVLSALEWPTLRGHLELIERAIDSALPGSITPVDCGVFRRARRGAGDPSI